MGEKLLLVFRLERLRFSDSLKTAAAHSRKISLVQLFVKKRSNSRGANF